MSEMKRILTLVEELLIQTDELEKRVCLLEANPANWTGLRHKALTQPKQQTEFKTHKQF